MPRLAESFEENTWIWEFGAFPGFEMLDHVGLGLEASVAEKAGYVECMHNDMLRVFVSAGVM